MMEKKAPAQVLAWRLLENAKNGESILRSQLYTPTVLDPTQNPNETLE